MLPWPQGLDIIIPSKHRKAFSATWLEYRGQNQIQKPTSPAPFPVTSGSDFPAIFYLKIKMRGLFTLEAFQDYFFPHGDLYNHYTGKIKETRDYHLTIKLRNIFFL